MALTSVRTAFCRHTPVHNGVKDAYVGVAEYTPYFFAHKPPYSYSFGTR